MYNTYTKYLIVFAITIGSSWFSYQYFSYVFPFIALDITTQRNEVLAYAQTIIEKQKELPDACPHQAVIFETDTNTTNFIERTYGIKALTHLIASHQAHPYVWRVRQYAPHTITEQSIFITPDKQLYGFETQVPDSWVSANITEKEAQVLALKTAQEWNISLENYILVAPSTTTTPSGRINHNFMYEMKNAQYEEIIHRITIIVSGNVVTTIKQYIKIPDLFLQEYTEMRSTNNTIAIIASVLFALLMLICGGFGLYYLFKNNLFDWYTSSFIGIIGAALVCMSQLNSFPLIWMQYNTSQAISAFLIRIIVLSVATCVMTYGTITFIYGIAEGLTRAAFKQKPLFKDSFNANCGTQPVLTQVIYGYALPSILLCFVLGFYYITMNYYGWWWPTETLINPNMLAHFIPALTPLVTAIQAGFLEECMFRAIPLATAQIIGKQYNCSRWLMPLAFIAQIILFGAAHANYPAQPAYARVLELIIPSSIFGYMYLYYGLLTSIITHVLYDLILMAIPLFTTHASGAWIQQILVIVIGLLPLLIQIWRSRSRYNNQIRTNNDWQAPEPTIDVPATNTVIEKVSINTTLLWVWNSISIVGLIIGIILLLQKPMSITPHTIQSLSAIKPEPRSLVDKQAIPFIMIQKYDNPSTYAQRYVWQKNASLYLTYCINNYLCPIGWTVRYAQFTGDMIDRTHQLYEFYTYQTDSPIIYRTREILHESISLPSLEKKAARILAHNHIREKMFLDPETLIVIDEVQHKRLHRIDWTFTFALPKDQSIDASIQQRIRVDIAGNQIIDYQKYIHVPEEWIREQTSYDSIFNILQIIIGLLIIAILCVGTYACIKKVSLSSLPYGEMAVYIGILTLLGILHNLNVLPRIISGSNTIEPLHTQLILSFLVMLVPIIMRSVIVIIGIYYSLYASRPLLFEYKLVTQFSTSIILLSFMAILALINGILPRTHPYIPDLLYMEAYFPSFYLIYFAINTMLSLTLIVLLFDHACMYITNGWRKYRLLGLCLGIILGAYINQEITVFATTSLPYLGIISFLFGVVFWLFYHLWGQYDQSLLLLLAFTLTMLYIGNYMASPFIFILTASYLLHVIKNKIHQMIM